MKPIRAILSMTCCLLLAAACAADSDLNEIQSVEAGDDASMNDEFAEGDENGSADEADADSLELEEEPAELTAFARAIEQDQVGADPTALNVNNTLHVYSTTKKYKEEGETHRMNIPHFSGDDPANIGTLAPPDEALPNEHRGKKLDGDIWAPTVQMAGGKYAMWYSGKIEGSEKRCLWRSVADAPEGPFERFGSGEPICRDSGWMIDPYLYETPGGFWLYAKVDTDLQRRRLKGDGLTFADGPKWQEQLKPSQDWEQGDGQNGPLIENPAIVQLSNKKGHKKKWILFYSANAWRTKHYGIGYAACGNGDEPGKCKKKSLEKGWMTSRVPGAPFGPGAASFFQYENSVYMIIHGWKNRCNDPDDPCESKKNLPSEGQRLPLRKQEGTPHVPVPRPPRCGR